MPRARDPIAATPADADARLERVIGPWAVGANAVNLTLGAGIFALPAAVAALLGPAAILAYLVCGVAVAFVLLCFAEVGSRVTRSGGVVAYVEEAFGPMAGWLAWVVFCVGFSILADAAIANVLVDSIAVALPVLSAGPARAVALAALFALLAIVNIRGIRQGVRLSVSITVAKMVPLVAVVTFGAGALRWQALRWSEWPSPAQVGEASLLLFFAFAGIESALTPSGEIRDPARTVPRGVLGATAALVALYVAIQLVCQGVVGAELGGLPSPLAIVAERLFGPFGRNMILAAIGISIFGALAADTIGTPRAFLAAAQHGMLPRRLAAVHPRFHTPHVAIAVFAITTALIAISGGFRPLAVLSSLALLLVYLAVCAATIRLRQVRPAAPGTFRIPGGWTVPLLGAAAVLWLMAQSSAGEWIGISAFAAVAIAVRLVRRRERDGD